MPPTILISNDDGINSEGLHKLHEALKPLGEVFVVAPDRDQSAVSHSLSLYRPLRIEQISDNIYTVDGTPTDCINLAVNGILKDRKPDLVVSGINKGENLGDDITYSGTVSAAMEGALLGITPSQYRLRPRLTSTSMRLPIIRRLLRAMFWKKISQRIPY